VLLWILLGRPSPSSPPLDASPARSVTTPARTRLQDQEIDAANSREPVAVQAAKTDEVVEPPGETETLVEGTLLGAEGKPIDNPDYPWVNFVGSNGDRHEADVPRGGNTYSIRQLQYGHYWIQAALHGYRMFEEAFVLEAGHPKVVKDLQFRAATVLSVFVRAPDGRNLDTVVMESIRPPPGIPDLTTLPRLIPIATRANPGAWIPEVIGSANNHFGVGHFLQYGRLARDRKEGSIGILIVDADLPVYANLVDCHAVLQSQFVAPGADEVDFVIAPDAIQINAATMTLRVLDATTKEPIPKAWASLSGGTGGGGGNADIDGRITARGCNPGFFHMTVGAEGYETFLQSVQLAPAKTTDLGEILLGRGMKLHFLVLSPTGEPCLTRFRFGVVDPRSMRIEMDESAGWCSNERGELDPPLLGPKLYVIRAGVGYVQNEQPLAGNILIDLRAGVLPPTQEIHMQRGSRLVLATKDSGPDRLRFRVIDRQGLEIVAEQLWGSAPLPLLLPRDQYRVELLNGDGDIIQSKSIDLGADPVTCELQR
jgi:hypothetical protein